MVGGTNGCEGVIIVILNAVHMSKFRCFLFIFILSVVGAVFLCCSSLCLEILQPGCPLVFSSGPAPK